MALYRKEREATGKLLACSKHLYVARPFVLVELVGKRGVVADADSPADVLKRNIARASIRDEHHACAIAPQSGEPADIAAVAGEIEVFL